MSRLTDLMKERDLARLEAERLGLNLAYVREQFRAALGWGDCFSFAAITEVLKAANEVVANGGLEGFKNLAKAIEVNRPAEDDRQDPLPFKH